MVLRKATSIPHFCILAVLVVATLFSGCSNPLVAAVVAARSAAIWSKVTVSPATGVVSNHAVTLSWSDTPGATSYNLYWSTSPNPTKSTATKIAAVSSPYVHSGLANNINYNYFLTAIGSAGESGPSTVISVLPIKLVAYVTQNATKNADVGLKAYTINPADGTLTAIPGSLSQTGPNTGSYYYSSITVDPFSKYAYISDWIFNASKTPGIVYTCKIDPISGALSFPGSGYTVSTEWSQAGQIAVDPSAKFAYVLNSPGGTQGSVNAYSIDPTTGILLAVSGYTPLSTGGAYGQASGIAVDPSGKFVYTVSNNFGGYPGTIAGFNINQTTGTLTATAWVPSSTNTANTYTPGLPYKGSNSIAFSPNGNFYVSEATSSLVIEAYKRPNSNGLPVTNGQYGPVGQNSFQVVVDPQGRFVFSYSVSYYTISAFKINVDGTLGTAIGPYSTVQGIYRDPVAFAVDPTGNFLYVVVSSATSPYPGAVLIYRINQTTGALTLICTDTTIGNNPNAIAVGSLP